MRATYAMLLVGTLLAGTLLVPYDVLTKGDATYTAVQTLPFPEQGPETPPGKVLVPFPDHWGPANAAPIYSSRLFLPGTVGLNPTPITLRLAAGMKVFPGARWLNVSIDAPNLPQGTGIDFEYTTADDRRGVRVVPNHGTYSLAIEEAMNDWSPDEYTRWTMRLYNNGVEGVEAYVNITVARARGSLPGHVLVNDRWDSEDARIVFDQKDRLRAASIGRQNLPMPDNRAPTSSAQLRGVPALELSEIQVHLHYNSTTPASLHFRPFLTWDSPRGDAYESPRSNVAPTQEQRGASGHFMWRIPVTPEMFDSLMGSRSRWQISVNWYGNNTEAHEYYMDGDYHFQVVAHRGPVETGPEARRS